MKQPRTAYRYDGFALSGLHLVATVSIPKASALGLLISLLQSSDRSIERFGQRTLKIGPLHTCYFFWFEEYTEAWRSRRAHLWERIDRLV